jgi:hypothetical protein
LGEAGTSAEQGNKDRSMTQLDRIESKLDTLMELMAAILDTEEREDIQLDLDGNSAGQQRDGNEILG